MTQLNTDQQKKRGTGITEALLYQERVHEERKVLLLNELECGRISSEAALGQIEEMAREKKYLSQHPYSIWFNEKENRWFTNLPKEGGGIRQIKYKEKAQLVRKIVQYYREVEERKYFSDAFNEWIEERREFQEIAESTYLKYKGIYQRHFHKDNPFCKIQLSKLKEIDVERFIKKQIRDESLTRKGYNDMKIILVGVLKYAKKAGYTTFSIGTFMIDFVVPPRLFAAKANRKDEEQVYNEIEVQKLIRYLREHNDRVENLGLILTFECGVRVGELAVLRWSDIEDNVLHISRTESCCEDRETGKKIRIESDRAKTPAGCRDIILPRQAMATLKAIRLHNPFAPQDAFLFQQKDGTFCTGKMFNYRLKKACESIGIMYRSSHKIRKTYSSTLMENHVDERIIINQMGHTNISMTKQAYTFNRKTRDEVTDIISTAVTV